MAYLLKQNRSWLLIVIYAVIWALLPSLYLHGMYLDSSENIAWSTTLAWGNYKHPPLGAWLVKGALWIMPTPLSAILFLSALCIIVMFLYLYRFGRLFLSHERTLFALLLTSTIYYFNSRSLQFNQNVLMLPFWAALGYYFSCCLLHNRLKHWIILGVVTALALLAKYETIILIAICFVYLLFNYKKAYTTHLIITSLIAIILFSPNLVWLIQHDFLPLSYIGGRGGVEVSSWKTLHITAPLKYLGTQVPVLVYPPLLAWLFSKTDKQLPIAQKSLQIALGFMPFIVVFFISLFVGMKIPTEWSYPFYIFTTMAAVCLFRFNITPRRLLAALWFTICAQLLIYSYYMVSMHYKKNIATLNRPAETIAKLSSNYWKSTLPNTPLKYVVGQNYFIGLIPAFEDRSVKTILNYSFIDSPFLDKNKVRQSGALNIVFGCPQQPPVKLKQLFPNNRISPAKCFSANTVNSLRPQAFHFAVFIVYPIRPSS